MKGIGVSTEDFFPLLNGVGKNGERGRSCRADKREIKGSCIESVHQGKEAEVLREREVWRGREGSMGREM